MATDEPDAGGQRDPAARVVSVTWSNPGDGDGESGCAEDRGEARCKQDAFEIQLAGMAAKKQSLSPLPLLYTSAEYLMVIFKVSYSMFVCVCLCVCLSVHVCVSVFRRGAIAVATGRDKAS